MKINTEHNIKFLYYYVLNNHFSVVFVFLDMFKNILALYVVFPKDTNTLTGNEKLYKFSKQSRTTLR